MRASEVSEKEVGKLKYQVRLYNGIDSLGRVTKQRHKSFFPDEDPTDDELDLYVWCGVLDKDKERVKSGIEKQLRYWTVWTEYLVGVPGIGPWIAGELILLLFYKHLPVCPKCAADVQTLHLGTHEARS